MANSYIEYTSGLTATTYSVPFNVLSITDVNVKGYNGTTWSDLTVSSRDAVAKTITLSGAPSAFQKIRVWRNTGTTQLVDFQNGSRLSESDLDTAYQQGLFVAQEVSEGASTAPQFKGDQGIQGIQGIQGPAGADGAGLGADGADGLTFLTGSNETDSGTVHMTINSAGHITTQYGDTSGYSQTSGSGGFAYVNDVGTAAGTGIFANNATRGWSNLYLNKFQWSSGQDTRFIQFTVNGSGAAGYINIASASTITYTTSSDYRLKENVVYDWDATTRLKQLKPARFNFILDGTDTPQDGFMAHEAQEVVPLSVSGTKDAMKDEEYEITPAVLDDDGVETEAAVMGTRSVIDPQSIDHSMLVPLLVKTIQELEARITALEDV